MVGVGGGALDDLQLVGRVGVADLDHEHEAVELGFGQRVGAFLLDRVLRRKDEERRIERVGLPRRGDPAFLHRLQQRGLRLGRRAVDLVGEQQVGEDRAADELEVAAAGGVVFFEDVGAGDVAGHQVGGELDAAEAQRERVGDGADEQRLGEAGHADEEAVAAGKERDEHLVDDLLLTDDAAADGVEDRRSRARGFVDGAAVDRARVAHFNNSKV